MRKIGYARVSTNEQNPELQIRALSDAGCHQVYVDQVSAVGRKRPAFDEALEKLKSGDALYVWKLDRAFRSTVDALLTWEKLKRQNVQLVISTLGLVSDTPEGRYFFRGLASAAEFERDLISARTREGMMIAKINGVHIGRPKALDQEAISRVKLERIIGTSVREIADRFHVSESTIRRVLEH